MNYRTALASILAGLTIGTGTTLAVLNTSAPAAADTQRAPLAVAAEAAAAELAAAEPTVPTVLVVDNTHGSWHGMRPVLRAYNRALPELHLELAQDCRQDLDAYCIVVDAYDQGDTTWGGLTTALTSRLAHLQLNTTDKYGDWNGTPRGQQAILCHELAHALGAPHPDEHTPADTRGCIAAVDPANTTPLPTSADVLMVRQGGTGWGAKTWEATR